MLNVLGVPRRESSRVMGINELTSNLGKAPSLIGRHKGIFPEDKEP